ncbi:MAG TPA: hypothetical protein VM284_02370 [Candidatus Limnocylindria bacterium]|nr:hypothetical protein [Candidatus Limnocylindria bacterium]
MAGWRFDFRPQPTMPPLAWVACARPGVVSVDHGTSVRTFESGFVEGTWVGPAHPAHLPESTTVFGSGMVARGHELLAVPPSHHLECVYFARVADALIVSNSMVGVLAAGGLTLDPVANYSDVFLESIKGCWLIDDRVGGELQLRHQRIDVPTTTVPITAWRVENLLINADLSVVQRRRPREAAWNSFGEFKERITAATRSLISNGAAYEPVVALSAGYDSPAVAAIAAAAGAKRATGFTTARPAANTSDTSDNGAGIAAALGLDFTPIARDAYRERTDLADADFLASGMAGEEVVFLGLEPEVGHSLLFNGWWGGTEWAESTRDAWRHVSPITCSGAGVTEFRLRADFVWLPLPVFGGIRTLDAPSLLDLAEMDPFRVGGSYERPVPRRLVEEAGVKRGTFATAKRAVSVLPPRDGLGAFSAAARGSINQFAAREGRGFDGRPRRPFSRYERAIMRGAQRLRLAPIADPLKRRQARLTHFEPGLGNVLLRWSVAVVSERYSAVERL